MDVAFFRQLQERSYVSIPFSVPEDFIRSTMNVFFSFLQLPDAVKSTIDFKLRPNHRRSDVGYKRRKESEGIYNDEKEFFHFHPDIYSKYSEFAAAHPAVQDFLDRANLLWHNANERLKTILSFFEPFYPGCLSRVYREV